MGINGLFGSSIPVKIMENEFIACFVWFVGLSREKKMYIWAEEFNLLFFLPFSITLDQIHETNEALGCYHFQ